MGKRIFSTLVLWAVAVLAIVYGKSAGFCALICALALGANYEVCTLLRKAGFAPKCAFVQIATILIFAFSTPDIFAALGLKIPCAATTASGDIIAGLSVAIMAAGLVKDPYGEYFKKTLLPTAAAIITVPFMLKWYAVSASSTGGEGYASIMFAVWIIAAAKFSDVGAYVIGAAFGRHKMAPTMSPNKTWEGAVGGMLSSAAIGAAFAWLGAKYGVWFSAITPLAAAIISLPIGATAIVSDLLESVFKRRIGVKDSGATIPGIGGMLDLADSLILCAPLAIFIKTAYILIYFNA